MHVIIVIPLSVCYMYDWSIMYFKHFVNMPCNLKITHPMQYGTIINW